MDSDVIRREIGATRARVDRSLELLAERSRRAARAGAWTLVGAVVVGAIAATVLVRRRARPRRQLAPVRGARFGVA